VKLVTSSIEFDLLYARRQRSLSDGRTDDLGRIAIPAVLDLGAERFVARAGRGQRPARLIVDDLAIDVLIAPANA
jgi:hypothetical protein